MKTNNTQKRKRGFPQGKPKRNLILDNECIEIIERFKKRSPVKATDSKIARYLIKKGGRDEREKIIEKINEHDTKKQWWQDKLDLYDKRQEEFDQA